MTSRPDRWPVKPGTPRSTIAELHAQGRWLISVPTKPPLDLRPGSNVRPLRAKEGR